MESFIADLPNLYSTTGDISDVNTLLCNRAELRKAFAAFEQEVRTKVLQEAEKAPEPAPSTESAPVLSLATGAKLNAATWSEFVARMRHHCLGEGVEAHCTRDAVFEVQERTLVYGLREEYGTELVAVFHECEYFEPSQAWDELEDDEKQELLTKSDLPLDTVFASLSTTEQWNVLAESDEIDVVGFIEQWRPLNWHLTPEAAQAFITRKSHDYPKGLRMSVECERYAWEFNEVRNAILHGKLVFKE